MKLPSADDQQNPDDRPRITDAGFVAYKLGLWESDRLDVREIPLPPAQIAELVAEEPLPGPDAEPEPDLTLRCDECGAPQTWALASITKLPLHERAATMLLYWGGLTQAEITQVLRPERSADKMSQPNVHRLLANAHKLLKPILAAPDSGDSVPYRAPLGPRSKQPEPDPPDPDIRPERKNIPCQRCEFKGSWKALRLHVRKLHPDLASPARSFSVDTFC